VAVTKGGLLFFTQLSSELNAGKASASDNDGLGRLDLLVEIPEGGPRLFGCTDILERCVLVGTPGGDDPIERSRR